MNLRNLLYFSKGERRALSLLLILISAAWITLIWTDSQVPGDAPPTPIVTAHNRDTAQSQFSDTSLPAPIEEKKKPRDDKSIYPPKRRFSKSPRQDTGTRHKYPRTEKFAAGTITELNTADTTILKKVPGIGSAFANRIVKYRNLLGGFYSVEQLSEVYGIDEERYEAIKEWFSVDLSAINQLKVNDRSAKELASHPYVSYKQAQSIERLVKRKGPLSGWDNIRLLEEFTEHDLLRLQPYFAFGQ